MRKILLYSLYGVKMKKFKEQMLQLGHQEQQSTQLVLIYGSNRTYGMGFVHQPVQYKKSINIYNSIKMLS